MPLSAGQQGLLYLERLAPGSAAYHIPVPLRVRGALDVEALERCLGRLVERHGVLDLTPVPSPIAPPSPGRGAPPPVSCGKTWLALAPSRRGVSRVA